MNFFRKNKAVISENINVGSLVELLLGVELGIEEEITSSFQMDKISNKSDMQNESLNITKAREYLGGITCVLNYAELRIERPEINIGSINAKKGARLGTYLLSTILLYNTCYAPITSNISALGAIKTEENPDGEVRRRGDREEINAVFDAWKKRLTEGGRPSQLLHLNYGFKFSLPDLSNHLFDYFENFDTSADFESKDNTSDSLLSTMMSVSMNQWDSDSSMRVYDTISKAYDSLIKYLFTLSDYHDIDADKEALIPISQQMIEVTKNRLKNSFIGKYKSLYKEALTKMQEFRYELKEELKSMKTAFTHSFYKNLLLAIKPEDFDEIRYQKCIDNFKQSRGMMELEYLIEDFEPTKATIPLPTPEKIEENFDLLVSYFNKFTRVKT